MSRPAYPLPEVVIPDGEGPFAGVVLGAEAWGINPFIRDVQRRLSDLGIASVVPDYYHGGGPSRVDYDDRSEVLASIEALDFVRATGDLVAAVDQLRTTPGVDPGRVAVWGYCTGGTLAWLAACQRGDIAAAVLFFPSQPVFAELGSRTPVNALDLVWQLTCPTLITYGDRDAIMSPERLDDLRARIDQWDVDAEIRIYPGAGHAFTSPDGPLRNDGADRRSWHDVLEFVSPLLGL